MSKKISLVLAIVMVASIFAMAMPLTAAAASAPFEVDGVAYTYEDALFAGVWEEAITEVTIKVTRDLTVDDFNGSLNDEDTRKLVGIARNTYYKYKRELRGVE